jgi:hypothetical protein
MMVRPLIPDHAAKSFVVVMQAAEFGDLDTLPCCGGCTVREFGASIDREGCVRQSW